MSPASISKNMTQFKVSIAEIFTPFNVATFGAAAVVVALGLAPIFVAAKGMLAQENTTRPTANASVTGTVTPSASHP